LDSRKARIVGLLVLVLLAAGPGRAETGAPTLALFPAQNPAGNSTAAAALERALWLEVSQWGRPVEPRDTRDALRRLRLRNGDQADPALLRLLGESLAVDWLVSTAIHGADGGAVPRVTLSVRVYSSATGELAWAGFRSASGLDGRGLLGRGVLSSLEVLVPRVVRELMGSLPAALTRDPGSLREPGSARGAVAVVPFGGSTARRATQNGATVTEATRARLFRAGVPMLSPNRTHGVLRRFQAGRFGGVSAQTRAALHDAGGASTILTGAVEAYEMGGSELEPNPEVAIAMRLVDGASGRILWTDARERTGRDGQGLFSSGRTWTRGSLADEMVDDLTRRLAEAKIELGRRKEGER
jgi:hypothetical protein